jgi:hypothetical protein
MMSKLVCSTAAFVLAVCTVATAFGAAITCDYYHRGQDWSNWGGTDSVAMAESFTQVDAQRSTTDDFAASAWWLNVGDDAFWDNNISTGATSTFYVRGRLKYDDANGAPQQLYSNHLGAW